tara:strand:- start:61 stop:432 length:372 start_codon:yes stop_codon:yes gene_type:complete
MNKIALLSGIGFCAFSIVLGAFGAHGLKDKLSDYSMSVFNTGVLYQFFHAIGIIIAVILDFSNSDLILNSAVWCFIAGIFLFSGSLYVLAITDIKWLGMITPIGGVLFIVGWVLMFVNVLKLN